MLRYKYKTQRKEVIEMIKMKDLMKKLICYIKSITPQKRLAAFICIPLALTTVAAAVLVLSAERIGSGKKEASSEETASESSAADYLQTDLPPNCLEYQSLGNGTCIVMGLGSFDGSELYIPDMSPFGDTVIGIGSGAFEKCSSLVSVSIPETVTSIGSGVFRGCSSLVLISVDPTNENYRSLGGVLYSKDKTVLICCPAAKIGNNFLLDPSVRMIDDYAFEKNHNITKILYENSTADFECITVGKGNENFLALPITCNYIPSK